MSTSWNNMKVQCLRKSYSGKSDWARNWFIKNLLTSYFLPGSLPDILFYSGALPPTSC